MVVALGPGKFYGSGLPRPRYYSDVKFNDERVDPPASVLDPLLSWAKEAHWSMGGLSYQRFRLQGRIEGSIKKLRAQNDLSDKKKAAAAKIKVSGLKLVSPESHDLVSAEAEEKIEKVAVDVMVPLQPKKKRARKLMEEFEKVAAEESAPQTKKSPALYAIKNDTPKKSKKKAVDLVASRTRSGKAHDDSKEKGAGGDSGVLSRRTSPRLKIA